MTKYTTPDAIPYPEATDTIDPLEDWLGLLAAAVQTAITPIVGTLTAASGWDLTGSYLSRVGKDVSLILSANRTAGPLAASSSASPCVVPAAFAPNVQFLQSGIAWYISAPYANPVQVGTDGQVLVFTTSSGQQQRFSANLRWRLA